MSTVFYLKLTPLFRILSYASAELSSVSSIGNSSGLLDSKMNDYIIDSKSVPQIMEEFNSIESKNSAPTVRLRLGRQCI